MKEKSDQELMRLIHRNHRPALEDLYERYVNLIYSYVLKMTAGDKEAAKDIVQQVFLRIWVTNNKYDPKKGKLANWIITITRNISIDYIRRERRHRDNIGLFEIQDHLEDENAQDVLQLVSQRMMTKEIRLAQNQLTEVQRRLISRMYWEGYTLKEIAEMDNEPIGTVKNRLHQALKKLHYLLANGKGGLKDGSKRMR